MGYSEEEVERSMTTQVIDLNQALLSVRKMMQNNHRIVCDSDGSYIEHETTGECMNMRDDGRTFLLKLWVKNQSF